MATPITRVSKITRTVFGSRLQTMQFLGLPYAHLANSTLNEKFAIQAGVLPPNVGGSPTLPRVRYYAIGNGGHRNQVGADNQPYTSPIKHAATDAALYKHLPFVLRRPSEDLDATARAKYGLRRLETINNVQYVAYYLRRLDVSNVVPRLLVNERVDGVVTSTPFVPTSANLNPVPPPIPPNGTVTTDGTTVSASAVLVLGFTENDVSEFMNAVNILFDNPYYGVISEVALVAGADLGVPLQLPGGGSGGSYQECVAATVTTHVTDYYPVAFANKGFDFNLDLGASEPLFVLDNG